MKIVVLNGSPKGETSVTMQYVAWIQKKFPQHELKIINIAQRIKSIEKDEKSFQEIIEDVRSANGVLWAFPLYIFTVASQYKRFIEMIWERGVEDVFADKYAATLSTSIHFFDHTAHNYMTAICDDLRMRFLGAFSAGMHDLLKQSSRRQVTLFAEDVFRAIGEDRPTSRRYALPHERSLDYVPGNVGAPVPVGGKKIVVLTDCDDEKGTLDKMVRRFTDSFSEEVEVLNLHDVDIKGGCLGCLHCGYDNVCSYQDGLVEFYNAKVRSADVLIYAGTINRRYLSSRWKMFIDRGFFHGHTPMLIGKQLAFIICGPLGEMADLKQVLEAYAALQQANLVDIVTDEHEQSSEVDALLQSLAERVVQCADQEYAKPPTFLGVGGMKIFRDDIWGRLRPIFQADHRAYKRLGIYDFPQKDRKVRIQTGIMAFLVKIPGFRKEFNRRMKKGMIIPLQKVIETYEE